jgi:integrase
MSRQVYWLGVGLALVALGLASTDWALWLIRPEVDKTTKSWIIPILPDLLPTLQKLCQGKEPTEWLFPQQTGNSDFDVHLAKAGLV